MPSHDRALLEAALIGLGLKLAEVENAIVNLKRRMKGGVKGPLILPSLAAQPRKRRFSATTRKKMAAARTKWWAARRAKTL